MALHMPESTDREGHRGTRSVTSSPCLSVFLPPSSSHLSLHLPLFPSLSLSLSLPPSRKHPEAEVMKRRHCRRIEWTDHDVQCCQAGVQKDGSPNKRFCHSFGSDDLQKDFQLLVLADVLRKNAVDTDVLWELRSLHETAAWAAERPGRHVGRLAD